MGDHLLEAYEKAAMIEEKRQHIIKNSMAFDGKTGKPFKLTKEELTDEIVLDIMRTEAEFRKQRNKELAKSKGFTVGDLMAFLAVVLLVTVMAFLFSIANMG